MKQQRSVTGNVRRNRTATRARSAKPSRLAQILNTTGSSSGQTAEPLFILRGQIDIPFLILMLTLLGVGLVMLFSASHAVAYYNTDNSYYYIGHQLLFAIGGIVAMLVASAVNYRFLSRFAWLLYLASIFLMGLCYFFPDENGAHRWIKLPGFNFQPSEIAKFALILLFATLMSRDQDKMQDWMTGTWRYLILYGGIAVVLLPQPHLSATLLIGIITVVMMLMAGSKFTHLLILGVCGLAVGAVILVVFWEPLTDYFAHVVTRLTYWLDPFSTTDPGSYQTRQSLLAIGSGGFWGVGFGDSRQKHMYLPEVRNDFVFAIACEELGFIGACLIIILFALLIWRGYTIAMRARDVMGSLLVIGITTQIGIQAFLNISVVTNLIPNTGISLPFFSYGGTALMIMLAQIGVVLSVSRQAHYEKE